MYVIFGSNLMSTAHTHVILFQQISKTKCHASELLDKVVRWRDISSMMSTCACQISFLARHQLN